MSYRLSRSAKVSIAVVAAVVGGLFGVIALIIRSDFVQRGCHHIPSEEWIYTANCTDAYNVGLFAGGMACLGLAALGWSLWRLQHV